MKLGEKIKEARRAKRVKVTKFMTQMDLANKIGVDHSWICRVESGDIVPDDAMISKIARVLKVSVSELVE